MSGLGGNLSYPKNKQFRNELSAITNPGGEGQEFRLIDDLAVAVAGGTLFIESTGDYIPGGVANNAKVVRVDHKDSVAKVVDVVLENRAPCDECEYDLGFTVVAKAQHPGVMNDNRYGQRRTYAHKFSALDAITSGELSDLDMMRAYADITQQINDDSGRYNGHLQGNTEAVVNAAQSLTFSVDVSTDHVYWLKTGITELVSDAVSAGRLSGAVTITLGVNGDGGFIIITAVTSATLKSAKITLITKSEYKDLTTFFVEKLSGTFSVITVGNFELLPWAEVFREFTHVAHTAPLSNHHFVEKPTNTLPWVKFILNTNHRASGMHGASESVGYLEQIIIYVPKNGNEDSLEALLNSWAAA